MTMYRFKASVAQFELRREPLGMWDIWVNDVATLTFPSAEEACQAVAAKQSGYAVWDNDPEEAPADLSGWETVEQET